MQNEYPIADDLTRKLHSRYLKQRDQWRVRYHEITMAIRALKAMLRMNQDDRFAQITIRSLRETAAIMMLNRAYISNGLCEYSYPYAPKEAVELAMGRAG
jgi:hypothetical protein